MLPLLQEAGIIDHPHPITILQRLQGIASNQIPQQISRPAAPPEQRLDPVGSNKSRPLSSIHPVLRSVGESSPSMNADADERVSTRLTAGASVSSNALRKPFQSIRVPVHSATVMA